MSTIIKLKKCQGCGTYLNITEFYPHKGHKDGLQSYCKKCQKRRGKNKVGTKGPYKNSIENFTDVQLSKELRKRGYTVKAKKRDLYKNDVEL